MRIFNSTYENALRVMLILDAFGSEQTLDKIYTADFMTVYGKTFGFSDTELNGDNQYKYSEFMVRRGIVQKALKDLVLKGMVVPIGDQARFTYELSAEGKKCCNNLSSEYVSEYRKAAANVTKALSERPNRSIIEYVNRMSAESIKEKAGNE